MSRNSGMGEGGGGEWVHPECENGTAMLESSYEPGCEEYSVGGGLGSFSCFKYKEMKKTILSPSVARIP